MVILHFSDTCHVGANTVVNIFQAGKVYARQQGCNMNRTSSLHRVSQPRRQMDKDPGDCSRMRCSPSQAGEQGVVQVLRTNKIGRGTGQGTVTSGLGFQRLSRVLAHGEGHSREGD